MLNLAVYFTVELLQFPRRSSPLSIDHESNHGCTPSTCVYCPHSEHRPMAFHVCLPRDQDRADRGYALTDCVHRVVHLAGEWAVVNIFIVVLFNRNPRNCPSTSPSPPCGIVIDVFLPFLTVMTSVEVLRRYCCSRIRSLLSCSVGRGVPRFRAATLRIEWTQYSTNGFVRVPCEIRRVGSM